MLRFVRSRAGLAVVAGVVVVAVVAVMVFVQLRAGSDATEGVLAPSIGPTEAAPDYSGSGPSAASGSAASGSAADGKRTVGDAAGATPEGGTVASNGVAVGSVARSLVRTARLTVEADDPADTTRRVRTAALGIGGTLTEEQSSGGGSSVVLRVPADALDRLMDDIGGLAHVVERSVQVVDATEEAVDLDARVASQQVSVDRVRALLAQATSIGDVVSVESELTRREADLDSLTGRLAALRDQVALSTLSVDVRRVGAPPPPDARAVGFLGGFASGWEGLRALGAGTGAVVGFVLPFLPVLGLLLVLGWLARRVIGRRVLATAGGRSGPGTEGES